MLNTIWFFMVVLSLGAGLVTGRAAALTDAVLAGGRSAVELALTMAGVLGAWTGLLRVAESAGLLDALARRLRPLLDRLFPGLPPAHPARPAIAANLIANLLGLGWAATPAGLRAMEALQQTNPRPERATREMCLFLILNMSSLQLICVNVLAYRSQAGSAAPAEILAPGLLATGISTLAALLAAKVCEALTRP